MDRPVFRPKCWSGKNRTAPFGPALSYAHSRIPAAFEEVQTIPPWRPQKSLSSAALFMYVTGIKHDSPSLAVAGSLNPDLLSISSQAISTSFRAAMSAIEQPARMFGRITLCSSEVRMSADSAMK